MIYFLQNKNDLLIELHEHYKNLFSISNITNSKDESNDKKTWYDVGSHSEFFYTVEVENE